MVLKQYTVLDSLSVLDLYQVGVFEWRLVVYVELLEYASCC